MIVLTPPTPKALTPAPFPRPRIGGVLPVGGSMAVCEVAGKVRVDINGEGQQAVAMLSPADALRLSLELARLASKLGA